MKRCALISRCKTPVLMQQNWPLPNDEQGSNLLVNSIRVTILFWRMKMEKLIAVLLGIAFVVFLSFLLSWPVMVLWNACIVPTISGVKEIDWMTGWGISILCSILFKPSNSK
jgi:hypothetical protein